MAILNSRNNLFAFNFSRDFLFPEVVERYQKYIDALPGPFRDVHEYINHTIQSVTFPAFNVENVQQVKKSQSLQWRYGWTLERGTTGELTITFKSTEGFLNYFVLFDQLSHFLSYENDKEFLPTLQLQLLDWDGNMYAIFNFQQVTFLNLSELELSFSNVNPDFRTFTATLHYNIVELKLADI